MNVLVVEDEPHTAQLLKEIIEQDKDFMVINMLDSIAETVGYLSKYHQNIDLLFLDINLSDGHSFEIFKHIDIDIPVVFCTAYDEYTLQAIKQNGIDYILKPFMDEEIHKSLQKYKKLVGKIQRKILPDFQSTIHKTTSKPAYQESFLTQHKEKSTVVYMKDIALFAIEYETVYIYTFDGRRMPVFKNLDYIASVCDPDLFYRINRQMFVNRNNILSFEPYFNRKAVLHLKVESEEKPIVSRLKVVPFKDWVEK